MSLGLAYISVEEVSADIQESVRGDTRTINTTRHWWSDPIEFFDWPGFEGKLAGISKLFLFGYSTPNGNYIQIDPGDDCYMAARDARFILRTLTAWSDRFEIQWQLKYDDHEFGRIADGVIHDDLFIAVNELLVIGSEDPLAVLETDAIDHEDSERTARLDSKHSLRSTQ